MINAFCGFTQPSSRRGVVGDGHASVARPHVDDPFPIAWQEQVIWQIDVHARDGESTMLKQRLLKWSAMLSAAAFAGIAGCEDLTGIFDGLLGVVGGA